MFCPSPTDREGRLRARSGHDCDDGGIPSPGIQDKSNEAQQQQQQQQHQDNNFANNIGRRRSAGLDPASPAADAGNSGLADEPPELLVAASPAPPAGSFCPAIIVPTRAPSALAAAAAVADCSAADSFLGFGLGSPPRELWSQEEKEEPGSSAGGRGRTQSSGAVDSGGGGCDLGWGELDAVDDVGRGRGRRGGEGEEEEEEEEEDVSCASDVEGRPSAVPDIDPNWAFEGSICVQTRSARARSSSFYEGDDADMLACINGEAPAKRSSSRRSSSFADAGDLRHGSLAYSSSGDFSASGDLDALLRQRHDSSGLTASQATAVKSAATAAAVAAAAAAAGARGGSEIPGGSPITLAVAPGKKKLGPRELKALQAGLQAPSRKYSSGDDRDLSSDSDLGSEDEDDDGEGDYFSGDERYFSGDHGEEPAYFPEEERALSPIEFDYRDVGVIPGGSQPAVRPELPDPFAYAPGAGVEGGVLPQHLGDRDAEAGGAGGSSGGGGGGDFLSSGSSCSLQALVGGQIFPPGVDPFLSAGSSSDGLALSPRAVMMSAGVVTDTATAAAAAAFPLSASSLSPPRPPAPAVTAVAATEDSVGSENVDPLGAEIPGARHPPLVLWPPAEDGGLPEAAAVAATETRGLTCEVGGGGGNGSPGSLCSPPAMLASLSLSGPPTSPRPAPAPSIDDDRGSELQPLGGSPPPSQFAPLPPPPEPLAPSPPRPPTPDAPSSEAPGAPQMGAEPGSGASSAHDGRSRGGAERGGLGSGGLSPFSLSPPLTSYDVLEERRGGEGRTRGGVGGGGGGSGWGGGSQANSLMPPPPPPGLKAAASHGSNSSGGGYGCRMGPAGPASSSFGSGGSGSGGGGGISRLMGPGGPFGSNRPGAGGSAVGYGSGSGARARYRSGGAGANGRSNLYGSAPGTLGDGSAQRERGLRGSSTMQGFLSVGNRPYGSRRGGAQQAKKIKLLMLGDSGVGKSSLMDRFTEDYFSVTKVQTLGVDFKLKTIVINEEEVDLQVWDTAGQQKFHKITRAYYRGSHGIVLVYDMSDPQTLDNTAYWMKSIRDTAGSNRVQICLVGNKVDLRQDRGQEAQQDGGSGMVETSTGRMVAKEFGADYFECSAKTGCMVEEAFIATATKAYEAHLVKPPTPSSKSRRRLGRKKHHRHASLGSDKDRPPRSDGSWSTSSSHSGLEGSMERLDGPRMRQCVSDAGESSSSTTSMSLSLAANTRSFSSASSSSSSPSGRTAGGGAGGVHLRHASSSSSYAVATPSTSSCSSPSISTPHDRTSTVTTPVGGDSRSPLQRQDQQDQQDQQEIRELVPPLSALSPKTAAAALGMGRDKDKGSAAGGGGEDSPTGTGTMSPLPGHQRSIGRASSLGDMETYFGTALTSPKSSDNDSNPDGGGSRRGAAVTTRRRADTGGLFGLFGVGGAGADAFADGDGNGGSGSGNGNRGCCSPRAAASEEGHHHRYHRDRSASGGSGAGSSPGVAEIIARQRQRSSPRATAGAGPWGDDPPPPAVSRMKGKKPPRVPRMKRMASGDSADGSGARGRGGKNVCKVS